MHCLCVITHISASLGSLEVPEKLSSIVGDGEDDGDIVFASFVFLVGVLHGYVSHDRVFS